MAGATLLKRLNGELYQRGFLAIFMYFDHTWPFWIYPSRPNINANINANINKVEKLFNGHG
jgi:hypothetical protein